MWASPQHSQRFLKNRAGSLWKEKMANQERIRGVTVPGEWVLERSRKTRGCQQRNGCPEGGTSWRVGGAGAGAVGMGRRGSCCFRALCHGRITQDTYSHYPAPNTDSPIVYTGKLQGMRPPFARKCRPVPSFPWTFGWAPLGPSLTEQQGRTSADSPSSHLGVMFLWDRV